MNEASLARALGLLGQSDIGKNLGLLAQEAAIGSLVLDANTEAKLDEALHHVQAMRDALIRALGLIEETSR